MQSRVAQTACLPYRRLAVGERRILDWFGDCHPRYDTLPVLRYSGKMLRRPDRAGSRFDSLSATTFKRRAIDFSIHYRNLAAE
jgi:hypothetical protein